MNKNYTQILKKSLLPGLLFCSLCSVKAQVHELQWVKTAGNTGNDQSRDILTDASGNVYTSGTFTGTVDFDPGTGTSNLTATGTGGSTFLSKSDTAGKLLWVKMIDPGGRIALDAAGNSYITANFSTATTDADPGTGSSLLTRKGTADAYIVKLDPSGTFIWAKQFGGTQQTNLNAITIDAGGNICVIGSFSGSTDFDPGTPVNNLTATGGMNVFIVKLNASGNFTWAKAFEGSSSSYGNGNQIVSDADGNIITTGSMHDTIDFDPGPGTKILQAASVVADIFISKLDKDGSFLWAKRIGGIEPDWAYSVAVDKSGAVYATGTVDGSADFNPDGGGYIISSSGTGSPDVYIAKFSSSGAFQWAQTYGGSLNESSGGIAIDDAGDLYLAGCFWGTANFNKGSTGPFYLIAPSTYDGFILKLDKNGIFYWVKQIKSDGASSANRINAITLDQKGNILLAGSHMGTSDFDPSGSATLNLSAAGQNDAFIMKMKLITPPISIANTTVNGPEVYPNPAHDILYLSFGRELNDAQLTLSDLSGKVVLQATHTSGITHQLDISVLPAGTYYLSVHSASVNAVQSVQKR